ncbi:hypothetical protein LguiB_009890 [Lonicera macranthoides]
MGQNPLANPPRGEDVYGDSFKSMLVLVMIPHEANTERWAHENGHKVTFIERIRGNLRLSGYSAYGQDGGVQLPLEYVEGILLATDLYLFLKGVADADLVLLVTTRPTTGNTLAWAVACERDQ